MNSAKCTASQNDFFSFNAHQLTIPSAFCVSLLDFFLKNNIVKFRSTCTIIVVLRDLLRYRQMVQIMRSLLSGRKTGLRLACCLTAAWRTRYTNWNRLNGSLQFPFIFCICCDNSHDSSQTSIYAPGCVFRVAREQWAVCTWLSHTLTSTIISWSLPGR